MMKNKQILFTKPNTAELVDVESNEINDNEVLVKTMFSAISAGTELANLIGEKNISGRIECCNNNFPRGLGYSSSGIVEKIGSNVKSIKKGDRVIVYFGQHKQYNIVNESNVFKIQSEAVSFEEAAFVVISLFPISGIRKTRLEMGESAMVIGLGILGQIAVQLCKIAGAVPIIASDIDENRRNTSLRFGADFALDPTDKNFNEKINEITDGKGISCIIEVSGFPMALNQALNCVSRFGRISLLGCTRNPVDNVDFYHKVHFPGVSLIGANNFARPDVDSMPGNWTAKDDANAVIKLIANKRLDIKSIISEIHSPIEANDVYNRLAFDKNFPNGVLFDWSKI